MASEKMTNRRYEYVKGLNGHSEIALYVDTFEEVDAAFKKAIKNGATPVLEPELEPWGQRTCYIADPEGNLIEIVDGCFAQLKSEIQTQ